MRKKNALKGIFLLSVLLALPSSGAQRPPSGGKSLSFEQDLLDWWPQRSGQRDAAEVGTVRVKGGPLNKARQIVIKRRTKNENDITLSGKTSGKIKKGDVLLYTFYARCKYSADESALGRMTVSASARTSDKNKVLFTRTLSVGKKWKRYYLPIEAPVDNKKGYVLSFRFGATKPQVIQIGELELLNYRNKRALDQLPRTEMYYPGMEKDAPWRKAAEERINRYRKEDLQIQVVDAQGNPIPNAKVHVELQKHAYGFGVALAVPAMFNPKDPENSKKYQETVTNLFNKVVFENRMKWKFFRDNDPQLKEAIEWCKSNELPIRGHCMVWPDWSRLPPKMEKEFADRPDAFRKEIDQHIRKMANVYPDAFSEWDIVNELYSQHTFVDMLGKEVVVDWFQTAKDANPSFKRYINDYAILAGNDQAHQDNYYEWIDYLLKNKAPVNGIGLQGHFRAPVPPEEIYRRLERFAQFGLDMQVTEYTFDESDELLQARFTRDFMTIVFSHPKTVGILTWCLWEKASYSSNASFYTKDWREKQIAQAWEYMVKKKWHTSASLNTNEKGEAQVRGFLGAYKISISANGKEKTVSYQLEKQADPLEIQL